MKVPLAIPPNKLSLAVAGVLSKPTFSWLKSSSAPPIKKSTNEKRYPNFSKFTFMSYSGWYLRWLLIPFASAGRCAAKIPNLAKALPVLNIFGLLAYFAQMYTALIEFGKYVKRNKKVKSFFALCTLETTLACTVSYFFAPIVHKIAVAASMKTLASAALFVSQLSGMLFCFSSMISFFKNIYLFRNNKNKLNLEKYAEPNQSETGENSNRVKLKNKIKLNKLDIVFSASMIFSSIAFCINPLVGASLLFGVGIAHQVIKKGYAAYLDCKNKPVAEHTDSIEQRYQKAKTQRGKMDIGFGLGVIASSIVFCVNPLIGAALFTGLGMTYFLTRKCQTRRINTTEAMLRASKEKAPGKITGKKKAAKKNVENNVAPKKKVCKGKCPKQKAIKSEAIEINGIKKLNKNNYASKEPLSGSMSFWKSPSSSDNISAHLENNTFRRIQSLP